ncbi:MAG TPA: ABC transporter ATP-binding protein, partial [Methylomirabilota bacterium]|nr:ABC transporter ATP-binding protein [Methylomirabilota bacterium]
MTAPARAIARAALRYRGRYLAGALCLLGATLFSLGIPWTVKHAVDALARDGAAAALGGHVGLIVALAAANGVARLGSRFAIVGAGQRVDADLRDALYTALQTFPPEFFARHSTGDLMTRATSDVAAVRSLVGFGAVSLVSTALAFAGALAAMLAVDPWLTLCAMAPMPALVWLARRFNGAVNRHTQASQEQLGALSSRVQETLAGMAVVRAYTMERRAAAAFAADNRELLERSVALAAIQARFTPLMALIAGVGVLVVLWVGGTDVARGRITLGDLVAFNGYLAYLAWPTVALGLTLSVVRRGLTSMERIQEVVLAARPAAGVVPEPLDGRASVAFAGLSWGYPGRGPALEDVTFEVAPGELVAIVGPTGAGKSTLGALLARLWEPPPGTVFVGGRDVTTAPLAAVRATIGWVPQEAFLFSRSIHDNVALGRADDAAVSAAAREAAVDDEVAAFSEGYATVVGERGLTVSGGQRQRLALARALVGRPRILVLDDVFASVDTAT